MTATEAPVNSTEWAEARVQGEVLKVFLRNEWTLAHSLPHLEDIADGVSGRGVRRLVFDASELGSWDSSLLIFLLQCQDYCDTNRLEFDASGLPEQIGRLLSLARAVPERAQPKAPTKRTFAARIGTRAITLFDDSAQGVTFFGEVARGVAGLATRRVHMRWREFWVTVQSNASGALGIVGLIAVLVGVIIAFLGVVVLKRFGAGYYVSYLVGFGMLREMGALMTGIIIAGRTGAAFAAELGSMKISEEIDAYTTLGISPIEHLVLPRVLALFVMMPLLTIYADVIGIGGGIFVSATMLDLSMKQFMNGMLSAVQLSDAVLGIVKGTVFGAIVGIAGCMKGLQAGSDASAVGKSATSAVVVGITGIIAANAVIDWLAALLDV